MEEIQMQEICANALSNYVASLNKLSENETTAELIQSFKASIRKCKEILIKFEHSNTVNKSTPLHKAFQMENMQMLSDIYITQDEMYIYRDSRKEDLKELEKQVEVFEAQIGSHSQQIGSITLEDAELEEITTVQNRFQTLQEEFLLTWSIISNMSEEITRFHKNLKTMESINSSEDDKYEARQFLSDFHRHEGQIEFQKQLRPKLEEHHEKIDDFIEE